MIRHTVTVLPPRKKNVKISSILANGKLCSDFNRVKKFFEVKNEEDKILFMLHFINMDGPHSVRLDYPNLYVELFLYDEQTKDYTKKFLKLKGENFLIKRKMFREEKIKLKVALKDKEEVIDYCLIDIV